MSSSLRDQISARRAAARQSASIPQASSFNPVQDRTVDDAIRKAAKSDDIYIDLLGITPTPISPPSPSSNTLTSSSSGKIQGTLRSFESVLRVAEDEDSKFAAFGQTGSGGSSQQQRKERTRRFTDPEEITNLKAGDNEISGLEIEFGAFGGLKSIDLHKNRLSGLPDSFADLLRLTAVDLSFNNLTSIPPQLLLLPALQNLNLSHNFITSISLTSPVGPTHDGLSYGAGFLSTSFSRANKAPSTIWPALCTLDLSHNKLTQDSLAGLTYFGTSSGSTKKTTSLPSLRVLKVAANDLEGVLDGEQWIQVAPSLAKLDVSHNEKLRGVIGLPSQIEIDRAGCAWGGSLATRSATSISQRGNGESSSSESVKATTPSGPPKSIPNPDATITYRTLPAASFDSEPLSIKFDVYLPSQPAGERGHPVVVWWHGGGLLQGNKENLPPHFRRLPSFSFPSSDIGEQCKEHVVVISPNYRLAPQAAILDILSDVTALLDFIKTRLNDQLAKLGKSNRIDTKRICLSGGSAGGYLALMAGLPVPSDEKDQVVGGYRGENSVNTSSFGSIKCIAPFYPISDLTHSFWATKTDPVPWWPTGSVPDIAARPHLNPRDPPVDSAISGGPRSILYPYMLQHALFPSLLFLSQRSVGGRGLDAFRPTYESLSPTHRLKLVIDSGSKKGEIVKMPPVYMVYGTLDDKVQPLEETAGLLKKACEVAGGAEVFVEVLEGVDHGYDEEPEVECESFRTWLGKNLI